jgi:hypothetical protein
LFVFGFPQEPLFGAALFYVYIPVAASMSRSDLIHICGGDYEVKLLRVCWVAR